MAAVTCRAGWLFKYFGDRHWTRPITGEICLLIFLFIFLMMMMKFPQGKKVHKVISNSFRVKASTMFLSCFFSLTSAIKPASHWDSTSSSHGSLKPASPQPAGSAGVPSVLLKNNILFQFFILQTSKRVDSKNLFFIYVYLSWKTQKWCMIY